jgi:hypothetical protein
MIAQERLQVLDVLLDRRRPHLRLDQQVLLEALHPLRGDVFRSEDLVLLAPLTVAVALEDPAVVVGLALAEDALALRPALLDQGVDGGVPARPVGDEPGFEGRPGGRGVAVAGAAPDRFLRHGSSLTQKLQEVRQGPSWRLF